MTKLLHKYLKNDDWHQHAQAIAGAVNLNHFGIPNDKANCKIIGQLHQKNPTKPLFCAFVYETKKNVKRSKKKKRLGRRKLDTKLTFTLGQISDDDLRNIVKLARENNQYIPFVAECRYEFALVQKRFIGGYILPPKAHAIIFKFCVQIVDNIYPDGREPAFHSKFKFGKQQFFCTYMQQGEVFSMGLANDRSTYIKKTPGVKNLNPMVLTVMQVRQYIFFRVFCRYKEGDIETPFLSIRDQGVIDHAYANFLKDSYC